jgi:hypothetical protein
MRWIARKQFVLLLVLALAVRLATGFFWQSRQPNRFGMGDSEGYFTLAQAIAEGRPYEYGPERAQVFRAPGYPLLMAPLFWFTNQDNAVMAARVENAVLGTLAVVGVWWLARQLFDARTAMAAALMAALYPEAIALSAMVLSETPFCAAMLLQFCLWTAACKAEKRRSALLLALAGGLVAGAATLIRPSWLLFTPAAAAVLAMLSRRAFSPLPLGEGQGVRAGRPESTSYLSPLLRSPHPNPLPAGEGTGNAGFPSALLFNIRWRHAAIAAAILAGICLAMLPWWIRNAHVTGHFVPTTLQVGASLYDGLSPYATGASDMKQVDQFVAEYRRQAPAVDGESSAAIEYRTDRRLREAALDWAVAHPGSALQLAGIKLLRMWNVWPNEASFSSWPVRLVVAVSYVPLLILGVIGAFRTIHRGWPYMLCWLPAIYFSVLHAVFVGSIRYRQPAMLGLIVLAAAAIVPQQSASSTAKS